MKNKILNFCEIKLIKIFMLFSALILVYFKFNIIKINLYEQILTDTITIVSIFVGILMSLMGFLLTVSEREVVKKIISLGASKLILKEFVFPIFSGLTIVIMSIFIKALANSPQTTLEVLSIIWAFFCIYFFLAFIRVIMIMYMILNRAFHELASDLPSSIEANQDSCEIENKYDDDNLPPIFPD